MREECMRRKTETVREILQKELQCHRALLDLEREKEHTILTRNTQKLESITVAQEKALHDITELETARIAYFEESSMNSSMTITEYVQSSGDTESEKFAQDLKITIQEIQALRDRNRVLMNDSVSFFQGILDELKEMNRQPGGYRADGLEKGDAAGAVLFSTQA